MKTITEFSGIILRQAAEALRKHRVANPPPTQKEDTVAVPVADLETVPVADQEMVPVSEGEAASPSEDPTSTDDGTKNPDAEVALSVAEEIAPATDASNEASVPPADVNLGVGPEADAVGAAMGLEGDRLSRLMEALDVAGKRVAQARLVRVVASDTAPEGAQKRGEFYFIVDHMPRQFNRQDSDQGRGGRGDDRRDRRDFSKGGGGRPNNEGGRNKTTGGKFAGGFAPREEMGTKGEVPRAGAGWMLTRAPEERRAAPDHRRGARSEPDPRKEFRGNRPDGGRGAGPRPDGRTFDRDARGPRSPNSRPPQGGRPTQGPRPPHDPRSEAANPGPSRVAGGSDRGRDPRHAGGNYRGPRPQPRRGGWDEPLVVDQAPVAAAPSDAANESLAEPKVASSSPSEGNT